ncbi:MAG: sodium:proton antiporter [Deltaproteobacteria bacterium]|nr:sodium:proton antiporter [Deltaproteobacteria bacterium]
MPLWWILPFAGILLSIALMPLFLPHFWHHHFPKVSAFWALVLAIPFMYYFRDVAVYEIAHIFMIDYIPFIILLWALYTVSGGIYIQGTLKGTPAVNTLILLVGTFLASVIGTTGASILLIRPILRSNAWRVHKAHTVVFFIFLVSNIGGALTPLGDPPLFLGFLHGVPFFWTMHILPEMAFASAVLLALYFILDSYYYKKEIKTDAPDAAPEPIKIEGSCNFIFMAVILAAVLFSGTVKLGEVDIAGIHQTIENLIKDAVLILMGILSLVLTRKEVRQGNDFSWAPILEVAYLFAGIFITIIPALAILKAGEQGALAWLVKSVNTPTHYFWATGILSSFLDNAPTYLTFFNSALAKFYPGVPEAGAVAGLIVENIPHLAAISAGAVFMGANTYIGNAPNFMMKSIAEEAGVKMPSFFGYMFKYSIPILVVLFIVITFIFF